MEQESEVLLDLSNLGTELLTKVFGCLDTIEDNTTIVQVCHAWRIAACDPCLWQNVTVQVNLDTALNTHVCAGMEKRGIRHIEIVSCGNRNRFHGFLVAMPNLETLKTEGGRYLTDRELSEVFHLDLSKLTEVEMYDSMIADHGVQALVRAARNIRVLSFSLCPGIKDKSLEVIASEAKQLQVLTLLHCPITNEGLKHLSGLDLVELNVQGCCGLSPASERFQILAQGFRALRRLTVNVGDAHDYQVLEFLKKHPALELLRLTNLNPFKRPDSFARTVKECARRGQPILRMESLFKSVRMLLECDSSL